MKPPKKVKAVWYALVTARGRIRFVEERTVMLRRIQDKNRGERIIPVLITPLSERGK